MLNALASRFSKPEKRSRRQGTGQRIILSPGKLEWHVSWRTGESERRERQGRQKFRAGGLLALRDDLDNKVSQVRQAHGRAQKARAAAEEDRLMEEEAQACARAEVLRLEDVQTANVERTPCPKADISLLAMVKKSLFAAHYRQEERKAAVMRSVRDRQKVKMGCLTGFRRLRLIFAKEANDRFAQQQQQLRKHHRPFMLDLGLGLGRYVLIRLWAEEAVQNFPGTQVFGMRIASRGNPRPRAIPARPFPPAARCAAPCAARAGSRNPPSAGPICS